MKVNKTTLTWMDCNELKLSYWKQTKSTDFYRLYDQNGRAFYPQRKSNRLSYSCLEVRSLVQVESSWVDYPKKNYLSYNRISITRTYLDVLTTITDRLHQPWEHIRQHGPGERYLKSSEHLEGPASIVPWGAWSGPLKSHLRHFLLYFTACIGCLENLYYWRYKQL